MNMKYAEISQILDHTDETDEKVNLKPTTTNSNSDLQSKVIKK